MSRFFVSLVVLFSFFFVFPLFSKTKKDNSVIIVDRPYRTLIVMPLKNLSGNKDYNFLSKDLRVFIASELKLLGTVIIRTDDVAKPTNLPPGFKRKFVFNSDRKRLLIVPDLNTFTNIDNPLLEDADYVVNGSFSSASKKIDDLNWAFTIGLSNTHTKKREHSSKILLPYRRVLEYSAALTEPIKKYLNSGVGWDIRIVSSNERTEVYSGENYVGYAPVTLFLKNATNVLIFRKESCSPVTNIILRSEASTQMNLLSVTMKKFSSKHVISITSRPKGCRAYMNEKFIGITPLSQFSAEGNDSILFVTCSNYRSAFMKADLFNKNNFHFSLKPAASFSHSRFSNKSLAWTSFLSGTAVLCTSLYYYWQSGYYEKLYYLKPSQSSMDKSNQNYNIGSTILLCTVPFFAATFYFTVKYSDEKDW